MLLPTNKNKSFRIALLGIYHESNTFVSGQTTIADFKNGRYLKGKSIIDEYKSAHHELGGAIEVLSNPQVELLPVFYTETTPGAIIAECAYLELVHEMMEELKKNLPVDACFVVPHGAAVAENYLDMDGSWLALLRTIIGDEIPVIGTLDPHANVSKLMISSTQGLFPYSTNPHIDQRETGKKAAQFLLDVLNRKFRPKQQLLQAPLAISIEQQITANEPCKSLYSFAQELSQSENILHVNIVLGFPYADVNEMGTSAIIITDNDEQNGERVKERLLAYLCNNKKKFVAEKEDFNEMITKIATSPKPVLLLDMGDNVGGGGYGNSTYLLEQLEKEPFKSFLCIWDQDAVTMCLKHTIQQSFSLYFGKNPETGHPFKSIVTLLSIHSGLFSEKKPRHGGQTNYDMGNTVIIRTTNGNTVMLHSKRVPPFSLTQITSCNINPANYDVIVAKGVVAPIAAYSPVCPTVVQVNSPGVTNASMTLFNYQNRRKPMYPFEG